MRGEEFLRILSAQAEAALQAARQPARNYSAALEQVRVLGLSQ